MLNPLVFVIILTVTYTDDKIRIKGKIQEKSDTMNITLKPDYLSGNDFYLLRCNPDRGWRIETYITLGSNTVMFNEGYTPEEFLDREIEHYKDLHVKTAQVYVYLNEYIKKPLDKQAFEQLHNYLELLRTRKLRALLRFTYEYDVNRRIGPTSKRIYSHIDQIKGWLIENKALVEQTVLVIQAGFIGAWGEWHTSKFPHNKKNILLKICDMCPDYLTVQTRRQEFKEKLHNYSEYKKIGYHDDYLVGIYHKWSTPKSNPNTANFKKFTEDSLYTLNDGEMPWGKDKQYNKGHIDGLKMLEGIMLRSLTTMSITHNYTENNGRFNAYRWRSEIVTPEILHDRSIPFFDSYFSKNNKKSIFDFITDHLGYMLGIDTIEITDNKIITTLHNNGFALPFGFSVLEILIDNGDRIKKYSTNNFDFNKLTRGSTFKFSINADTEGIKSIGIKLTKPIENFDSIRFANICDFKDGVNWFEI